MKRWVIAASAILLFLLAPLQAWAGLIINRDEAPRKVSISSGAGRATVAIPAGKAVVFRCERAPCTVSLVGTKDRVRVTGDEQDVRIEGGRLTLQSP